MYPARVPKVSSGLYQFCKTFHEVCKMIVNARSDLKQNVCCKRNLFVTATKILLVKELTKMLILYMHISIHRTYILSNILGKLA